jgi:hypothetical protein
VTERINPFEEETRALSWRFHQQWEPHRQRQLNFYFPADSLVNVEEDERIESWTDSFILIRPLRNILPFGTHLFHPEYSYFLDNSRQRIVDYAQEQIFYWHLAHATSWSGSPVEQIAVCVGDNYFWSTHVPTSQQNIITSLGAGIPVHFLNRFRVSHQVIELAFSQLCLISNPDLDNPYLIGVTPGDEFQYSFSDDTWRPTALEEQPLIDPPNFYLPLQSRPLALDAPSESLPSSSPRPSLPSLVSAWSFDDRPVIPDCTCTEDHCTCNVYPCICRKEICSCGYRPDTPPTPTNITLWHPGSHHLPSNPCA